MDRQRLEQEALQHISRGNLEGALRSFQGILKLDPRDKRVRQKVGELYVRMNRPKDAENAFREVVDALMKEGSHRAAVSVFKQLVQIRPDDPQIQFDLGECYVQSGYPNDARTHFDQAMRLHLGAGKSLDAARAARRLADLAPGDAPLRIKLAELLEAGGDKTAALAVYRGVIDEFRRRGRPDEVGRVSELVLKIAPEDLGFLLDAAAARLEAGDVKRALSHLQPAYVKDPMEPRTLDLLARAFEEAGQTDKAAKILTKLADIAAERGDTAIETDALRRADKLTPGDADLARRLADSEARQSRRERRLTTLALSQPAGEAELAALVKAEVQLRYGFADRSEATLRTALDAAPEAPSLLAALAELWIASGRTQEALRIIERLVPRAGSDVEAVLERITVLRGPAPPAAPEPEPIPEDESDEARGDRLADRGDRDGALAAYRLVLAEDPLNEEVLGKIATLRAAARSGPPSQPSPPAPPVRPPPVEDAPFAEISPDALEEASDTWDMLGEARALVDTGRHRDALAVVSGRPGLGARVLESLAWQGLGELARAADVLREGTNDAPETDPAYPEALWELSGILARTGKQRGAARLLDELTDINPDFRPSEVAARQESLRRSLG